MSGTRVRAWRAVSDRLRTVLPPEITDRFVGGTHTQRFADNLLPGLSQSQIVTLRAQLALGSGGELRPTVTAKRPAHAPSSSAALAANAFGRWLGHESELRLGDLGGFTEQLSIEARLKIPNGGGTANLDCLLKSDDVIVGVESKFTETLEAHSPVEWRAPNRTPKTKDLLQGGWRDVFAASLGHSWQPAHLGVEQLVKHTLALAARPAEERHLVYIYWEPSNAEAHPEVLAHRAEVAELVDRVGDATPQLHVRTYGEQFEQWSAMTTPEWLEQHVAELRARYELTVPTD